MKNAIITGGNGLLGYALKKKLGSENTFIKKSECDLMNYQQLDEYILKKKTTEDADTIIHCAVSLNDIDPEIDIDEQVFYNNYLINKNIIEVAAMYKYKNFISILSPYLLEDKINSHKHYNPKFRFNQGLINSKKLLYHQTNFFGKTIPDSNWISIIPSHLYGQREKIDVDVKCPINTIMLEAYKSIVKDTDFFIPYNKSFTYQFVFSEDMANIISWSKDNWKKEEPLIATNIKEYSVTEIASIIANKFGISENKIIFDKDKKHNPFKKHTKTDLSWFEFTPLEEGLEKTLEWFDVQINTYDII